jgi:hypothetical protein
MKNLKLTFILLIISTVFINSCKKLDKLPIMDSISFTILNDSLICTSKVLVSSSEVNERGICWSTIMEPTINDLKVSDGKGMGNFVCVIKGISSDVRYYLRSYAINTDGVSYGETKVLHFGKITTNEIMQISSNSAQTGGEILNDYGFPIISRGICWNTYGNPSINDSFISLGNGTGSFETKISNLKSNTTYHARAYGKSSFGTIYGDIKTFKTLTSDIPTLSTINYSNVTVSSFECGGLISSIGASPIINKGLCWSTSKNPTINDNYTYDGSFGASFKIKINNMIPNTTYYVRAFATNSFGTGYGEEIIIKTMALSVGSFWQGGVISYIFQPGDIGYVANQTHGIIVAPVNQSTSAQWGCRGINIAPTYDYTGAGPGNTQVIVNNCNIGGFAAKLCFDLILYGYSDWHLPSTEEFWWVGKNITIINQCLLNNGGTLLNQNTLYWTSKQATNNFAWALYPIESTVAFRDIDKNSSVSVRAMRQF